MLSVWIDLSKVLEGFEMTYTEFVDMCILCGCDYCENLPRVSQNCFQSTLN